jgi:hypothetical protein
MPQPSSSNVWLCSVQRSLRTGNMQLSSRLRRRSGHAVEAKIRVMPCDDGMAWSFLNCLPSSCIDSTKGSSGDCSAVACQSLESKHLVVSSLSLSSHSFSFRALAGLCRVCPCCWQVMLFYVVALSCFYVYGFHLAALQSGRAYARATVYGTP